MKLKTKVFELSNGRYRNLSELAQAMGISASHIYRVRRDERRINEKFIAGAIQAFPEYGFNDLFYFTSEEERVSTGAQQAGRLVFDDAGQKAVKIFIKLVEAMRPKQTDQWKLQTEAVQAAIDELRTCFANIGISAKSLDAKLAGERETSRRAVVQEVIHVARETEGKLSQLYQVYGLLAGSSTSDDKR